MKLKFRKIQVNIEGASHSDRITIRMEGFPSDAKFDKESLQSFMDRRHGDGSYLAELCSTARREPDLVEWDKDRGEVLEAHILNRDIKSSDYDKLRSVLRPGHADLGAYLKYGKEGLQPGGGEFSGRMTAAFCVAGGIAKQLLEQKGVRVDSYIMSIGGMPCVFMEEDDEEEFCEMIASAAEEGDSLGGVVGCCVSGYPGGIGGPGMDGLEGDLAKALLAIPSAKGVEFGSGFEGAYSRGSVNNDEYYIDGDRIYTKRNRQGGISGGISTGMKLTMNVAFKPVPSIGLMQRTVDIERMSETDLCIEGRHDVCIVPRVLPVVEAMVALTLLDRLEAEDE